MRRGIRGARPGGIVKLRYLMRVTTRGRDWWYVRVAGRIVGAALPDLPHDHPDFLAAYAERLRAVKAEPALPGQGSIAALCDDFLRSPLYRGKAPAYRATIGRHVAAIRAKAGTAQARHLEARHVAADLATLSPSVGQHRLKAWRLLAAWGLSVGHLLADPTEGVKRPRRPKSPGHLPWTAAEVAAFRARWPIGTTSRAIFELLHWTGARISDAVRLGPGQVGRDGVLAYRQAKTGELAYVPWLGPLPEDLEAIEPDRALMHEALLPLRGHMTYLATKGGRARSAKAIGGDVSAAARAAGVAKSAHGLRKTRATTLADLGLSAHRIASWTGHQSLGEIEQYTREADRRRAAQGPKLQSGSGQTAKREQI